MSYIDRIFCSSDFEGHFPLASARTLPRTPSDHVPILWESRHDQEIKRGRFKFEKWWIRHETLRSVVEQT
jgi:hypothetical protein